MKTEFKTINVSLKDGVAVFGFNNPPVNQLSPHFVREMGEAFTEAFEDEAVKAIVITGTGRNFIAGADIVQLYPVKEKTTFLPLVMEMARFYDQIETGPKPVIAAINGNCLGGGLELAMVCHYRIAAQGVNLGQPEVQIGLIPGAGGTQRLPRLVGLPTAMEMITTGQPIKADKAKDKGLVDEVVSAEELAETALKAAGKFVSGKLKLKPCMTRNKFDRFPSAAEKKAIIAFGKAAAAKKGKGYIAPFKAIEAMEKGLSFDIEADIAREVDLFCDCAISDVAKNLILIFLNTRSAGKLPRIEGVEPRKIKKVGMLGGGVMGSGIVHLLLRNGFETVLWEINDDALQKALGGVKKTFAYHVKKKKMAEADVARLMQERLVTTTSLEDLKDVDLVIEAVVENMAVKQDIWSRLEKICRPDVYFGTNTSALPITEMASVLADPTRMIGLHFFNPAERMPLLEIICTGHTSDENLASSVAFGRAIKKVPIVVNDGPGFYVSRQLGGLMGGSVALLASGVDFQAIEEAMVDFGMPMGPFTLADLTGLDINYHVNKTFEKKMGERYAVHPLIERIFQTGCYGRKTKAGWYDYSGEKPVFNTRVMQVVEEYRKENNVAPRQMSKKEIVDFMLANGINEAAYMMQEGICDRPPDMDLAMIYGTGFPPYRGGILRYADAWGVKNVYEHLLKLQQEGGPRLNPAGLLKEMAEKGTKFYPY